MGGRSSKQQEVEHREVSAGCCACFGKVVSIQRGLTGPFCGTAGVLISSCGDAKLLNAVRVVEAYAALKIDVGCVAGEHSLKGMPIPYSSTSRPPACLQMC